MLRRPGRLAAALAAVGLLLTGAAGPASSQGPPPTAGLRAVSARGEAGVYVVQLAEQPVAANRDGEHFDPNDNSVRRQAQSLDNRHAQVLAASGAPASAKFYDYHYSFNGFAAELTAAQASAVAAQPGVVSVTLDTLQHPTTDDTPVFLGLTGPGGLWAQTGGVGSAGEDVIVGVVDTGIWPEHPSFSDQGDLADRPGRSGNANRVYDAPPSYWHGACQSGEQWSRNDCNNKLIGARYYLSGFGHFGVIQDDYKSARDADGHGTHTSSTAAGNAGVDPSIFGRDLGVDTVSGMAPRARVAMYKACWNGDGGGCASSDLVAAIDQAVADGVDVINYSIGSDTPSLLTPDGVSFLFAADAGVFVSVSAGNAGPGATTVGSPASAPWVTAVGASTHPRMFANTVTLGDGTALQGVSVTPGTDVLPLVSGADAGSELCVPGELDPAVVAGKIVLCKRGLVARVEKSQAVALAGGAGMVLYNGVPNQDVETDNHYVPSTHLELEEGQVVADYIEAAGAGATAQLSGGSRADDPTAPIMAAFSSRGPNGAAGDIIKPDVTAPGVQILAGASPTPLLGAPGQLFQSIAGTSMSSPHVAGVGALLTQLHPDWTPAQIRSALTTTGRQDVEKEDGVTPADPFDFGGGHIAPLPAADPGLVYDSGFVDYLQFLCGAGELSSTGSTCTSVGSIDPSDLNLATIGIDGLAGFQTVTRRATNVGPAATYTPTVDAPAGIDVVVDPPVLALAAGETAEYTVTFTTTPGATLDQWAFGALTWSDGDHAVRSPIAIRPVALAFPAEVAGTGTDGSAEWEVTFGYSGVFDAQPHGLVPATTEDSVVIDDPANDINVALATGVGINVHEIQVAAGTRHLRASLFDDFTDGADDLDLYLFDCTDNDNCVNVDGSGSGTSAEQVDVDDPAAGTWLVVVHGWQTDGPDAAYTLFSWQLGDDAAGNLTVTAPAIATLGATGAISVDWAGLTAGTKYLGSVSYGNGVDEVGETLVAIDA